MLIGPILSPRFLNWHGLRRWIIVNYDSSKTDAERVVTAITDAGGTGTAIQGDFSEPEEIAATFAEIKRRFGKFDILVNNAGIYNHLPIDQITAEDLHRHYNLNVLGPLLAIKEAIALAAVPPFPPKLQGAMERAGTVTEEQFRVMLADCGNDEVWFKSDVADVVYLGLSSRGATQNALHPSQSNRPDCVSAAQVDEEQEAAAYSHQR